MIPRRLVLSGAAACGIAFALPLRAADRPNPMPEELREALRDKLVRQNGLDVTPGQIIVTNGLTHGSFAAIMAFIDPGDEAILLEPFYPQHIGKIELAGGTVVTAPLDAANGFRIDPALIEPKNCPGCVASVTLLGMDSPRSAKNFTRVSLAE